MFWTGLFTGGVVDRSFRASSPSHLDSFTPSLYLCSKATAAAFFLPRGASDHVETYHKPSLAFFVRTNAAAGFIASSQFFRAIFNFNCLDSAFPPARVACFWLLFVLMSSLDLPKGNFAQRVVFGLPVIVLLGSNALLGCTWRPELWPHTFLVFCCERINFRYCSLPIPPYL